MFNNQIIAGSSGQGGFEIEQSLKFNDDESQYLSWTPASTGNRKTWTFSAWVKRGNLGEKVLFVADNGTLQTLIRIRSDDTLQVGRWNGTGYSFDLRTTAVLRDVSAWYNICVALDTTEATSSDRVKVYINGVQVTAFGTASYPSLNFDTDISNTLAHGLGNFAGGSGSVYYDGYLADVYFIDGTALDPTSFGETVDGYWKAKEASGLTYGSNGFHLTFQDDIVSEGFNTVTYNGTGATQSVSGLGFEPDLVWYKRRNSAASHQIYDLIRGVGNTMFTNATSAESFDANVLRSFDSDGFTIGSEAGSNSSGDNFVAWAWDAGANNTPTGHSSVTYTGNGSTQSIRGLGFEPDLVWCKRRDAAANHVIYDSVRGTGAELSSSTTAAESTGVPGVTAFDADGFTLGNNGNINDLNETYVGWCWDAGTGSPASNTDGDITSTVKASSANGFSIVSYTGTGSAATIGHGLSSAPSLVMVKSRSNDTGDGFIVYHSGLTSASYWLDLSSTGAQSGPNSAVWNGTAPTSSVFSVGTASGTNTSGYTYIAYCFAEVAGYSDFGSYTGNGSTSGPTITTGFRPGFVMVKRTDTTGDWIIQDTTRAPLGTIDVRLFANDSSAEVSNGNGNMTVDDTSFTITNAHSSMNASGGTYIYMAFKGSYSDYVSDYNTDGSIDSRVKANPSYGFSVASYVGTGSAATIGHGLSSAPDMVIVKSRDDTYNWGVYHSGLTSADYALQLNTTIAESNTWDYWNDTDPTSSVFSVGTELGSNKSGSDYIAYCFHSVSGYSSFGSYSGTGATGNAVTTGFRPAFVMIKRTDTTGNWFILDNTRSADNKGDDYLYPDLSNAEDANLGSSYLRDFTATGFTSQNTQSYDNASGGTYIYMAFADTRAYAFWKDVSGNGNHWTPNNLDYRDSLPDTPTNNFATLNPLNKWSGTTLSEGNTKVVHGSSANGWVATGTTMGLPNSGKWYAETRVGTISGSDYVAIGIVEGNPSFVAQSGDSARFAWGRLYFGHNGIVGPSNTTVQSTSVAPTYTTGDIISIAWDGDNGDVWWAKNGVWTNSGNPATGTNPAYTGLSGDFQISLEGYTTSQAVFNAGQDSTFAGAEPMGAYTDANGIGNFQYAPPNGFLSLCTSNLTAPTIVDGSQHFNTVLYVGDFSTSNPITGVGFSPDFVWIKDRGLTTVYNYSHALFDTVRGAGKWISTNRTDAEFDYGTGTTSALRSFDSDGFTVGQNYNTNEVDPVADYFVSWSWKAGGAAVSNTSGSITSQVSANTDMGFSIVSYTGTGSNATVGHGLSTAPSMVIVKNRSAADGWLVWHEGLSSGTSYLLLHSTNAQASNSAYFNGSPTSSVFNIGTSTNTNGSGNNLIAYCFANSDIVKCGSYTGNGSADGTFVYTGFRPAWVLIKSTGIVQSWNMTDTTRRPYNYNDLRLLANLSNAEEVRGSADNIDMLSNGFKIRSTATILNDSSNYIYLAFAETPFKYATAR